MTTEPKTAAHQDELLELIPAYRAGELSPAQAHKLSLRLRDDKTFRLEAEREELVVETLRAMKVTPLPRGLVTKAVREAVGNASTSSWLSLDTLLVALGVGVGCAASAQLLSGKVDILPVFGTWIGSLAGVAVDGSLGQLIGGVGLVSVALLFGGVLWTLRAMRSKG